MPIPLSDRRIEEYLQTLDQSEDDQQSSGEEEIDEEIFYHNNRELLAELDDDVDVEERSEELVEGTPDDPPLEDPQDDEDPPLMQGDCGEPQPSRPAAASRSRRIIWRRNNFYTSISLAVYLAKEGLLCLGTIQSNRIPNNKLPDKKTLMKRTVPRGHYEERVANVDDVDISAVVWKDNKPVTLLSTYTGAQPVSTIPRYDKARKQRVPINCPQVIKDYNAHMGGVDLLDSFIGRYHITRKSRKWTNILFFHLLDMTIINSWLVFKKCFRQQANSGALLNLCMFRLELADTLCNLGQQSNNNIKRRRPSSSLEAELQLKKRRGPAQIMPPKDVRQDNTDHWQQWGDRGRCKYPQCKGLLY